MLVLMMMDVGCWDAELLSWEALADSSQHTFAQMSLCVRVWVWVCYTATERNMVKWARYVLKLDTKSTLPMLFFYEIVDSVFFNEMKFALYINYK